MSNIVERLDEIIAKNVALEISGMSEEIKAHYRAAFCGETAAEIVRSNEELGAALAKAASEITRLEAEISSLKACEGTDTDTLPRYSMKRMRDEIAKAKAYARAEALEDALREALLCPVGTQEGWQGKLDMRNEIAAAIRRLKEGA